MTGHILDDVFEGHPPITHTQAREAAHDLVDHFFKNEPRKGGGVLVSIPVRSDNTDVTLLRYIQEQERKEAALAGLIEAARGVAEALENITNFTDMSSRYVEADPLIEASRTALAAFRTASGETGND